MISPAAFKNWIEPKPSSVTVIRMRGLSFLSESDTAGVPSAATVAMTAGFGSRRKSRIFPDGGTEILGMTAA